MKQKVVVIGHGYTSRLGVIRALGRAGYEVIVVVILSSATLPKDFKPKKPIDCYSKYVSQVYYCPHDRDALVDLLLKQCAVVGQKVVVFPDSDFSAAAIDLNQERLRENFLFPHINHEPGAVVSWMDKLRQKECAKALGMNVADGWIIEVKEGNYSIPVQIKYPCFPKPLATLTGGKGGLKKCEDEDDLRDVISILVKRMTNITILVEEYKVIESEHALMGVSDGNNVIIPGIIHTQALACGGHFGVAKQAVIKPIKGYEDLVEKFKLFVRKTGYVGVFDIDFYKSEGKYFFCEMNLRYGGSGYAYTKMGVNLPVMFVKSIVGESIDEMNKDILDECIFVNERMCIDDWYHGYITTYQLNEMLQSSDISFVKDDDDPMPYTALKNEMRYMRMKRMLRKLLSK